MTSSIKRFRNRSPQRARSTRQGGQLSPAYSNPYAWFDAGLGGSSSGITDSSAYARAAMTLGSTTAAPLWLAYSQPSLYAASAGNPVSAPDSNALDVTGDIELRGYFEADSWRSSANRGFISKTDGSGAGGQLAYTFGVTAANVLNLTWQISSGASFVTQNSTAQIVDPGDGVGQWLRVTLDVDNGASGYDLKFWTSTDPPTTAPGSVSWTQLGSTVVGGAVTTIKATTNIVAIGSEANGSRGFNGRVYRAQILNGIAGTVVADFDASLCTQSGYTDAYSNVWTVNRGTSGRKVVVQSVTASSTASLFLLGTDDNMAGPAAAIPPCANAASASMFAVIRPWATQSSGKVIFTTRSGAGAGVTLRMASATTIVADVSDGTTTNTTPAVTFTPGLRAVVGVHLSSGGTAYCSVNNTTGSTVARPSNTQAGGALTIGSTSAGANFLDAEMRVPWFALDHLASAAEIATLTSFYGGGL